MTIAYAVAWLVNGQWRTYSVEASQEKAYQVASELRMVGETAHVEVCYCNIGREVQS